MVYGIDRTDRKHFISDLDTTYLNEINIDTKCLDLDMRMDVFKKIIIVNASVSKR